MLIVMFKNGVMKMDPKDKKGTFHTDESNSDFELGKDEPVPDTAETDSDQRYNDVFEEDDFEENDDLFEK
jgi:hypothetical protein